MDVVKNLTIHSSRPLLCSVGLILALVIGGCMFLESLSALSGAIDTWRNSANDKREEKRRRACAIGAVMDAAIATKAYLTDIRDGTKQSRDKEHDLARLWQRAAVEISEYDRQLVTSAELKALGWADPSEWQRAAGREWVIKIDNIIGQCHWLRDNG